MRIISLRRPLSAGKRVQVSCESSGSRPAAVLTWWLGSKQLTHVTEEASNLVNTTSSTVHYTAAIEDNGKVLSCRADHSILPDSALEDSWLLDVYCEFDFSFSLSVAASLSYYFLSVIFYSMYAGQSGIACCFASLDIPIPRFDTVFNRVMENDKSVSILSLRSHPSVTPL